MTVLVLTYVVSGIFNFSTELRVVFYFVVEKSRLRVSSFLYTHSGGCSSLSRLHYVSQMLSSTHSLLSVSVSSSLCLLLNNLPGLKPEVKKDLPRPDKKITYTLYIYILSLYISLWRSLILSFWHYLYFPPLAPTGVKMTILPVLTC